jgi:hypothetical protein
MRSVRLCVLAILASGLGLNHAARARDVSTHVPDAAAPAPSKACGSFRELATTACPLIWHGITPFGAYDLGVGIKSKEELLRFFGGYAHIRQTNASNPLGVGATDQGGYLMSGVEDNNLDSPKIVQIWWTGVKYAFDDQADLTAAWQSPFLTAPASPITTTATPLQ